MSNPNIIIVSNHFYREKPTPPYRIHAEIVVMSKGEDEHPTLFQIKDDAINIDDVLLRDDRLLTPTKDSFVVVGSVERTNKKKKTIYLTDGSIVTYKYLILVSGSKAGYSGKVKPDEFQGGIQSLFEALKVRKNLSSTFLDLNQEHTTLSEGKILHASQEEEITKVELLFKDALICGKEKAGLSYIDRKLFEVFM